jgi:hypothetical protein
VSNRFLKLPPELRYINAVLRGFVPTDEEYGNIPSVAFLQ